MQVTKINPATHYAIAQNRRVSIKRIEKACKNAIRESLFSLLLLKSLSKHLKNKFNKNETKKINEPQFLRLFYFN